MADTDKFETVEETFKKDVPFSFWVSPMSKVKRLLLGPYRAAQKYDKAWDAEKKKYMDRQEMKKERSKKKKSFWTLKKKAKILPSEWLKDGGEVVIGKNVDKDLL